mmetsp:Transcript_35071/g.35594  ORF Transcript_35071/g.35594 Transcript_35071/m.35594 type:complete len:104 (+) Transcript_35071:18-329(+)
MSSSSSTSTATSSGILSWRCRYLWLLWKKWRRIFTMFVFRRYFHTYPPASTEGSVAVAVVGGGAIKSHSYSTTTIMVLNYYRYNIPLVLPLPFVHGDWGEADG